MIFYFFHHLFDIFLIGQCTGFKREEFINYFPTDLHPNTPLPKQNMERCDFEHAMITFHSKNNIEAPKVNICYAYTFNVRKNIKPGYKLPCGLEWSEIDIVLSICDPTEIFDFYIPRSGGNLQTLSHLKIIFIDKIYRQEPQLLTAMKLYKSDLNIDQTVSDFKARFKQCGLKHETDFHYRMPGIPDYTIQTWLMFIATGMKSGYQTKGVVKYWGT